MVMPLSALQSVQAFFAAANRRKWAEYRMWIHPAVEWVLFRKGLIWRERWRGSHT